jgi:hypothetical protein
MDVEFWHGDIDQSPNDLCALSIFPHLDLRYKKWEPDQCTTHSFIQTAEVLSGRKHLGKSEFYYGPYLYGTHICLTFSL